MRKFDLIAHLTYFTFIPNKQILILIFSSYFLSFIFLFSFVPIEVYLIHIHKNRKLPSLGFYLLFFKLIFRQRRLKIRYHEYKKKKKKDNWKIDWSVHHFITYALRATPTHGILAWNSCNLDFGVFDYSNSCTI